MGTNSIPKTFLIHASTKNGKKNGFLRLRSFQTEEGEVKYEMMMVSRKSEASRYLNFDNVKKMSYSFMKKYSLKDMKIIDSTTGKTYNVKNSKGKVKEV